MKQIETNAEVQRAWVATLSDAQIDDPIHTASPEDELENYGIDADAMETIDRREIKSFIAKEVDRNDVEHTQEKVRMQIEEKLLDMFHVGNSIASNGIKTAFARFLKTILIEFFSRAADDDVILESFE